MLLFPSSIVFADLGNTMAEFAGIAASGEIFGVSRYVSVPLCALIIWLIVVRGSYRVVEKFFIFGCTIYLSYIVCGFIISPNWLEIAQAVITPDFSSIKKPIFLLLLALLEQPLLHGCNFISNRPLLKKALKQRTSGFLKLIFS